jgi:hypothetical protein
MNEPTSERAEKMKMKKWVQMGHTRKELELLQKAEQKVLLIKLSR